MFNHCAIVFALLIASICIDKTQNVDSSVCGDWASYQDEYTIDWCYKIVDDTFRNFDEAVSGCAKLDSSATLPIIRNKAEQDFLSNYLFKVAGKIESFWIGAKFSSTSKKFHWIDNTEVSFTNWDANGARSKPNYCVEIQGDEPLRHGKWIDEPCDIKKNLVVCQKMQPWTLAHLQKTFLETRKEMNDSHEETKARIKKDEEENQASKKELTDLLASAQNHIKSLEQNIASIKSELSSSLEAVKTRLQTQEQSTKALTDSQANAQNQIKGLEQNHLSAKNELTSTVETTKNRIQSLEKNPVPIGFIYVQLPGQPEPLAIWPGLGWSHVTGNYAGQFFRAEGGGSAAFGTVQNGESPRLTSVACEYLPEDDSNLGTFGLAQGQWTPLIRTGSGAGDGDHHAIRFLVSNTEVRPRNQAVRIWKRTN